MRETHPTPQRRRVGVGLAAGVAALALVVGSSAAATAAEPLVAPTVANPSFESGLDGWTSTGAFGSATTETGGYNSDSRLAHWLEAAGTTTTSQEVTNLAEGWWTVRAHVKAGGAVAASELSLTGCGLDGSTTLPSTEADDAWLELAVSGYVSGDTCTISLTTSGAAGAWAGLDMVSMEPGTIDRDIRGADLSSISKNEAFGAVYRNADGSVGDPVEIIADAGANLVRLKVWVDPADGYNTTQQVVESAVRADDAGMGVLIDFHYSDRWTDPAAQGMPAAWVGLDAAAVADKVYEHTTEVLTAVMDAGVSPQYVQVGNEINPGMLWPLGQTWDVDTTDGVEGAQWDNLALFLTAGGNAVRDVTPDAEIILHLTNINNGIDGLTWWFDEVSARDVPFDVIGLSYYAFWHGTLADLQNAVSTLGERYDRDVLVVETSYPFTLEDDTSSAPWENVVLDPALLMAGYPATVEGQTANFRAVQDVVASAPGGRGIGAVYWEPAWTSIAGNGWDPADDSSGNAWENQAFFDFDGIALSSMSTFAADTRAAASLSLGDAIDLGTGEATARIAPTEVTVTNTGSATFTGAVDLTVTGDFELDQTTDTVTLAPGDSVAVGTVSLSESAVGDYTGTLALSATASTTQARVDTVTAGSIEVTAAILAPESPGAGTPGEETPGTEVPGEEVPPVETPDAETPGTEVPGEEVPVEEPGTQAPVEETPSEVPAAEEPGVVVPSDSTPSTDTPSSGTPSETVSGSDLPQTGVNPFGFIASALALIGAGLAATVIVRRRGRAK